MTPEKEIELCETVATISADLKNCITNMSQMYQKLNEHTQADADNFEKMDAKLEVLIGEDNKRLGAARNRASFWTAVQVVGGVGGWEILKRVFHIG